MGTIESAWTAFMAAIAEGRELHHRGGSDLEVADLLRHARELVDIIEAEIAEHPIGIPGAAGAVLAQLRGRLRSLERDVGAPSLH